MKSLIFSLLLLGSIFSQPLLDPSFPRASERISYQDPSLQFASDRQEIEDGLNDPVIRAELYSRIFEAMDAGIIVPNPSPGSQEWLIQRCLNGGIKLEGTKMVIPRLLVKLVS